MADPVVTAWTNNGGTSVATSLAANDVGLMWAVSDSSATTFSSLPTGFSEVARVTSTADGMTIWLAMKPQCSGSEGTISVTASTTSVVGALGITNLDNTTQPDVTVVTASNSTAAASAWTLAASVTPATSGALIVCLMGSDITSSSASDVVHTFATTSGTTGAWTTHAESNEGAWMKAGIGSALQASAGALTVTGTGTLATKSAGRAIILLALRPAGGASAGGTLVNGILVRGLLARGLAG